MAVPELADGSIVDGRYAIVRRLGGGGMGSVYEAQQIKLQRLVALKVLRPEFAHQELAAKRFEREAKAASAIDHRNVVKILDFGLLDSGSFYYTMELLKGRDLATLLRAEGPIPWARAGWILLQVVRAFAAVHALGIIHRDIKPANCFLLDPKPGDEPDLVKILDFGIANVESARGSTALTGVSDIVGTALYMAPEQALYGHVDTRTDVYSLGVMMYELLTGGVPFTGDNAFAILNAHQTQQPVPLRQRVPTIPPPIEAVVLAALTKDPARRYPSMLHVEAALAPYVAIPGVPLHEHGQSRTDRYAQAPAPMSDSGRVASAGATPMPWGLTPGAQALSTPRQQAPRPVRGRRTLARASWAMLALAIVGAAGVSAWSLFRGTGKGPAVEVPRAENLEPPDAPAPDASPPTAPPRVVELAPPPPERQYDPFSDPFGAPSLASRALPLPRAPEGAGAEPAPEPPQTDLALLDQLPSEPWAAEVGRIEGRVVREGGVVEGAGVCAWLSDPRAPLELRRKPRCARSDRRGRFSLAEIPPGFYDLSVFADEYLPQSLSQREGALTMVVVLPGQTRRGVEFKLVAGGAEATGSVRDVDGKPIVGARVAALGDVRALAVAGEDGTFRLWVGEGPLAVVAWATGYTDVVRHGKTGEAFDLELRREAVLMGKVLWEDNDEPVAYARVYAGAAEGVDPMVYADAEGSFRIPALPAGQYRPSARSDAGYVEAPALTLAEGTISSSIVLELQRVQEAAPAASLEPPPVPSPDVPPPETTPVPAPEEGEKALSDAVIRRRLIRKIRSCGVTGEVEIRAKYVLENGALFLPEVELGRGEDRAQRGCVETAARNVVFRPRKQPSLFPPLRIGPEGKP